MKGYGELVNDDGSNGKVKITKLGDAVNGQIPYQLKFDNLSNDEVDKEFKITCEYQSRGMEKAISNTISYKVDHKPQILSIESNLMNDLVDNKVKTDDFIFFKLLFTTEDNAIIEDGKIKLVQRLSENSYEELVVHQDYEIKIKGFEKNKNIKNVYINFLKERKYKNLSFIYLNDDKNIIKDLSKGVDINVVSHEEIITKLNLDTEYDLDKPLSMHETIEFFVTSSTKIDWKNEKTGIDLVLLDKNENQLKLNNYFDFIWDDTKTNDYLVHFILRSNKKRNNVLFFVQLMVVKKNNQEIRSNRNIILLSENKY